jgi:hypothetical protein
MTPREIGVKHLRSQATNQTLLAIFIGVFAGVPVALTGWLLSFVLSIPIGYVISLAVAGLAVWLSTIQQRGGRKQRLLEIQMLSECVPFYEAYRAGRLLQSERPPKSDFEQKELREKYHRSKEVIAGQIKSHQQDKERLQGNGKRKEAEGMAALILDLEDAEKQLQKELALLERAYHQTQEPRVEMARPPIAAQERIEETGLERY